MIAPTTFDALAIILLAVVPGFIATSFWARARTWKGRSTDFITVLQSVSVSVVIQLLMAPATLYWLYPVHTALDRHPDLVAKWLFCAVLVVPIAGGMVVGLVMDRMADPQGWFRRTRFGASFVQRFDIGRTPTMWDWLFKTDIPDGAYLVVEFNDGKRVAGEYVAPARAQTSPDAQGLYLRNEWILDADGDLYEKLPGSAGVMIPSNDNIRLIRVLKGEPDAEGSNADQGQRDQGPGGSNADPTGVASSAQGVETLASK